MKNLFIKIFSILYFILVFIIPIKFSVLPESSGSYRRIQTIVSPSLSWEIKVPEYAPVRWNGITKIIKDLETGRNWYWSRLTPEAQEKIVKRILASEGLVPFLKEKYPDYRIVSIMVKGSFIYGFESEDAYEEYEPKDIDITIIVEGDLNRREVISLTKEEKLQIFGEHPERCASKLQIAIFGTTTIVDSLREGDPNIVARAMSDRGNGVWIAGPSLYQEEPPDWAWLISIKDLSKNFEENFSAFQKYRFTENQKMYLYQLLIKESEDKLSEDEKLKLAEYRNTLKLQRTAFLRAVKRIIELNLRIKHWLEIHGQPFLILSFQQPFLIPGIFADENKLSLQNIILKGVTEDFYSPINLLLEGRFEEIEKYIFPYYGVSDKLAEDLRAAYYDFIQPYIEELFSQYSTSGSIP